MKAEKWTAKRSFTGEVALFKWIISANCFLWTRRRRVSPSTWPAPHSILLVRAFGTRLQMIILQPWEMRWGKISLVSQDETINKSNFPSRIHDTKTSPFVMAADDPFYWSEQSIARYAIPFGQSLKGLLPLTRSLGWYPADVLPRLNWPAREYDPARYRFWFSSVAQLPAELPRIIFAWWNYLHRPRNTHGIANTY